MASNAGATSSSYTTTATTYDSGGVPPASFDADNGDYFRCRVNATGASEVVSNSAQLTVTRSITTDTHPQATTGAVGGTAQFSVAASLSDGDSADINYQWQLSLDDGNNFSSISGANSATYTTPTLTKPSLMSINIVYYYQQLVRLMYSLTLLSYR